MYVSIKDLYFLLLAIGVGILVGKIIHWFQNRFPGE